MRVMIAGVGHPNLRDLSIGPALVPTLRDMTWPDEVDVDDWSFGPIAVVQRIEDRPGHYERIVLLSAVERGLEPGTVTCCRWDGALPDAEEIQARIGEAVMGIISIDNLLIVGEHFRAWPSDVRVVEVEPDACEFGMDFSPRIAASLDDIVAAVRRAALDEDHG